MLANRLGYFYLDTGCMYRATTLAALKAGIDMSEEEVVSQLACTIDMEINSPSGETSISNGTVPYGQV